jgi:short-subunit dehydrogenase
MSFKDKVVWITGASSGIGEALAKAFAREGASVILSGRRMQELERVADEAGGRTLILPFEATDHHALPGIVEQAWTWQGTVDLLVNNAGIGQRGLAIDTQFNVYRKLIEVDFLAPLHLTQLVLPRMVAQGNGHIAVISSLAGRIGIPLRAGYCAAKHAVNGYFEALRTEIEAAYRIKVSVILLGSARTNIAQNAIAGDGSQHGQSDANIDNGMAPGKVAEVVLTGLAEGQREILVAEGWELAAAYARNHDPERVFTNLAEEGARLAAQRRESRSS